MTEPTRIKMSSLLQTLKSKYSLHTFSKATIASLAATVVDFGTLTLWVEGFHGFYPIGVAMGAALGAITNFTINRIWSFNDAEPSKLGPQAFRYGVVSVGSLLLNTGFVYLVTEKLHVHYMLSKIAVAFIVGLVFNYPLHRHYVYPKQESVPVDF